MLTDKPFLSHLHNVFKSTFQFVVNYFLLIILLCIQFKRGFYKELRKSKLLKVLHIPIIIISLSLGKYNGPNRQYRVSTQTENQ